MLQFSQLSIRRGVDLLFEGATFNIHPGQKVGLTGANGTGKSSLFALVLGELHADSGSFSVPAAWTIAHVAQFTPQDERACIEYVLDGDEGFRELEQLIAKAEHNHEGEKLAELHAAYDHIGGYQARSRAARLMHGLGFSAGQENLPVNHFSGGWRMRLNLARALMCRSDLLLLDEPTNHLDLDAVIWLENWLLSYPGTLLLISHDRDFLDRVCQHIAHIEQNSLTLYTGNYTLFEKTRAARLAGQQADFEKQQREIAHIKSYVDRFRAKASKARQAQSRLKALQRMEQIAPAHVDSPFHFRFLEADRYPEPLLKIDEAVIGYPDKTVLNKVNMTITPGDRIGLLGPNGAGKSTLIKTIAGTLVLNGGDYLKAQDLKIGYFAQHQVDQLHPEHSPLEHLQQMDRRASEQQLRNFLGGFGFTNDKALAKTAPFSGGEKARLALALIVYRKPNLLLLDEPTNHLDIEMRQALAQALQDFNGALVLVSHDRHLLRVSCDQLLIVMDGKVDEFGLSIDEYPKWLAEQQNRLAKLFSEQPSADNSAAARKERKRIEAEQRKKRQPLLKRLQDTESKIKTLGDEQKQLEAEMSDNSLYEPANTEQLKALIERKGQVDIELEDNEYLWLEISEQLENFSDELA
jgi:ATP-binding cassette subfamily F protein 3